MPDHYSRWLGAITAFAIAAVLVLFIRSFRKIITFIIPVAIIVAAIIYGWRIVANKISESVKEDEEMIAEAMDDLR